VVRIAVAGLGKMGLSHLAITRAHPAAEVIAACDPAGYVTDMLSKYTGLRCHADYARMLAEERLDAVLIATPPQLHADMVEQALARGLHVFCEKPFVLEPARGERLAALAAERGLVNQVGYHYRFVGAFREAARLVRAGALGRLHHVRAEAYGPVVLRPAGNGWRFTRSAAGGALHDYGCHAVDLANFIVGAPAAVSGVARASVFSRDVEDEVYCSLHYGGGMHGQLCVNWSDDSYRKMFTRVSVWGTLGHLVADRQELRLYLREPHAGPPAAPKGWTTLDTAQLTPPVGFYLRGEEYSAQIDHFLRNVEARRLDGENGFASALQADRVVAMIAGEGGAPAAVADAAIRPGRGGMLRRLFR